MATSIDEPMGMPRSALRHRPIYPDAQSVVLVPRATKEQAMQQTRVLPEALLDRRQDRSLLLISLSMVAMMLLLWLGQCVTFWGGQLSDTLRYGYPRTTQLDYAVGYGSGKSHFIATNVHGQIYVLEIPADHAEATQLLVGPHLTGTDADLAPVTLTFTGDPAHPDLILTVHGLQERFRNTGKGYVSG